MATQRVETEAEYELWKGDESYVVESIHSVADVDLDAETVTLIDPPAHELGEGVRALVENDLYAEALRIRREAAVSDRGPSSDLGLAAAVDGGH